MVCRLPTSLLAYAATGQRGMSGTDLAYAATGRSSIGFCVCCYARATRCAVLTRRMALPGRAWAVESASISGTPPYAMSGTDVAYGAMQHRIRCYRVWCYRPTRCYEMCGTDIAYGAMHRYVMSSTDEAYGAMHRYVMSSTDIAYAAPSGVSSLRAGWHPHLPTLRAYALATRCPYNLSRYRSISHSPRLRVGVKSAICLRACYTMSGTGTAYGAIGLRACYADSGTDIPYGAIGLRATHSPVLSWCPSPTCLRAMRCLERKRTQSPYKVYQQRVFLCLIPQCTSSSGSISIPLPRYAAAMRSPVRDVRYCPSVWHAMSSSDLAYHVHVRYQPSCLCGTEIAHGATRCAVCCYSRSSRLQHQRGRIQVPSVLRSRYAMSGTDLACASTHLLRDVHCSPSLSCYMPAMQWPLSLPILLRMLPVLTCTTSTDLGYAATRSMEQVVGLGVGPYKICFGKAGRVPTELHSGFEETGITVPCPHETLDPRT
eukprot:3611831-Rhodomonas_salina.3